MVSMFINWYMPNYITTHHRLQYTHWSHFLLCFPTPKSRRVSCSAVTLPPETPLSSSQVLPPPSIEIHYWIDWSHLLSIQKGITKFPSNIFTRLCVTGRSTEKEFWMEAQKKQRRPSGLYSSCGIINSDVPLGVDGQSLTPALPLYLLSGVTFLHLAFQLARFSLQGHV